MDIPDHLGFYLQRDEFGSVENSNPFCDPNKLLITQSVMRDRSVDGCRREDKLYNVLRLLTVHHLQTPDKHRLLEAWMNSLRNL